MKHHLDPVRKPLTPEEVPEKFRPFFDFGSQRWGEKKEDKPRRTQILRTCSVCGKVDEVAVSTVRCSFRENTYTGFCLICHTSRFYRLRNPIGPGARCPAWKGGRYKTRDGYINVKVKKEETPRKSGYIFEHRLVMQRSLGRQLLRTETVHHKNGQRDDNRIENLELWGKSHSSGQRYKDLSTQELLHLIEDLQDMVKARTKKEKIA